VTFNEYDAFCNATGKDNLNDFGMGRGSRPVISVSWFDAVEYCNWRSRKENLTPCYTINGNKVTCNFSVNGYRLPTEAEWEFAAKGGNLIVIIWMMWDGIGATQEAGHILWARNR
jgi:formylglycine-generating enzyme required for sulfatase activity